MINTPDTIRETKRSPLDWFCANCVRDYPSLNAHGRCPSCDSNSVKQFAITLAKEPKQWTET